MYSSPLNSSLSHKYPAQETAITQGQICIVVDDLLATGGTLDAACQLIDKAGAKVLECLCIVELSELQGRRKVAAPCWALLDLPAGC